MLKTVTSIAGVIFATTAISAQTTPMTKSAPAMATTHKVTTTKTMVTRHATNVPMKGVSLARAERIALNARPGKVVGHRMEKERGGMAYSFDIRSRGKTFEVDVNRNNGRIVQNRLEKAARG